MYSPKQALTRASDGSEPLPLPNQLHDLAQQGFNPRRGTVLLIAGQPGDGKSAFVQWWLAIANYPSMVFAADMTQFESVSRQAAVLSGWTVADVEAVMEAGESSQNIGVLTEALAGSRLFFNNESEPTGDTIIDELEAYCEVWNEYPHVLVFDNLRNFCDENDAADQNKFMAAMQTLSRESGALVVVLTHTTENTSASPGFPQARRDVINKVTQYCQYVVTVAVDQRYDLFRVAVVKARGAKFDKTGETFVEFRSDLGRASFAPVEPVWAPAPTTQWGYSG